MMCFMMFRSRVDRVIMLSNERFDMHYKGLKSRYLHDCIHAPSIVDMFHLRQGKVVAVLFIISFVLTCQIKVFIVFKLVLSGANIVMELCLNRDLAASNVLTLFSRVLIVFDWRAE